MYDEVEFKSQAQNQSHIVHNIPCTMIVHHNYGYGYVKMGTFVNGLGLVKKKDYFNFTITDFVSLE